MTGYAFLEENILSKSRDLLVFSTFLHYSLSNGFILFFWQWSYSYFLSKKDPWTQAHRRASLQGKHCQTYFKGILFLSYAISGSRMHVWYSALTRGVKSHSRSSAISRPTSESTPRSSRLFATLMTAGKGSRSLEIWRWVLDAEWIFVKRLGWMKPNRSYLLIPSKCNRQRM